MIPPQPGAGSNGISFHDAPTLVKRFGQVGRASLSVTVGVVEDHNAETTVITRAPYG